MNRTEFISALKNQHDQALAIVEAKNSDYSEESDCFSNFKDGLIDPHLAIFSRMGDKFNRCKQILKNGQAATIDETLKDTLLDLANYAHIMIAYLEHEQA